MKLFFRLFLVLFLVGSMSVISGCSDDNDDLCSVCQTANCSCDENSCMCTLGNCVCGG